MSKYPEVVTATMCAEVSDVDIARDISDTELEIADRRRLQKAEAEVAATHPSPMERRMAAFRANGRAAQISDREEFVAFLRRLQAARAADRGTP